MNYSFTSLKLVLATALLMAGSLANAAINASLKASRLEGPAPLAVKFDAIDTTSTKYSNKADEFRLLAYNFNFDDSGSGNWPYSGKSKNTESGGPIAAHVFEKAGTYRVTVSVEDSNGEKDTASIEIKVYDPDSYYSGSNTVCISKGSDFSGAPSGCDRKSSVPSIQSGKRYLLRAGETFGSISPAFVNDWQIGRFGSGSDPVIDGNVKVNSANPGSRTNWATNGVVMDLNVKGQLTQEVSAENILFLRNTATQRFAIGGSTSYYFENNTGSSSKEYVWPKNIFIVENSVNVSKNDGYDLYGKANGFAILGNHLANASEHNIRIPLAYKSIIAHNYLVNPGSKRHHIKLHGQGLDNFEERLIDSRDSSTQYVVISNNKIGNGEDIDWSIAICPFNSKVVNGLQDVIVEQNRFNLNAKTEIVFGGKRLTSRSNNWSNDNKVDTGTGCHTTALPSSWIGPYYIDHTLISSGSSGSSSDPSAPTPPLNLVVEIID